jgi:hypothetical protein
MILRLAHLTSSVHMSIRAGSRIGRELRRLLREIAYDALQQHPVQLKLSAKKKVICIVHKALMLFAVYCP